MKLNYDSLLSFEFSPLSEVKAKLSEKIRQIVQQSSRIAITQQGRPTAVLLSYEDYLSLIQKIEKNPPQKIYDFEDWKKTKYDRKKVSQSILDLFDTKNLTRKGQKNYKKERIREFHR